MIIPKGMYKKMTEPVKDTVGQTVEQVGGVDKFINKANDILAIATDSTGDSWREDIPTDVVGVCDLLDEAIALLARQPVQVDDGVKYAIALQRAIEFHCSDLEVPSAIAEKCPHHAQKLNKQLLTQNIALHKELKSLEEESFREEFLIPEYKFE